MAPRNLIATARDRLIDAGLMTRADIDRDIAALEAHLARPDVQVNSNMFFRLTGRVTRGAARPH